MKTLPRIVLAVMSLVGPLAMAEPAAQRPVVAVESSEMRIVPAEHDALPVAAPVSELEQRVKELESEVAQVQAQQDYRFQLPEAWNASTVGP